MGVNQYTVILERTGECNPEATSPLRSDDDGNFVKIFAAPGRRNS